MLLGGLADQATVDLGRDPYDEPARVRAFRQGLGNRLAGRSQVGEHVAYDIGDTAARRQSWQPASHEGLHWRGHEASLETTVAR